MVLLSVSVLCKMVSAITSDGFIALDLFIHHHIFISSINCDGVTHGVNNDTSIIKITSHIIYFL